MLGVKHRKIIGIGINMNKKYRITVVIIPLLIQIQILSLFSQSRHPIIAENGIVVSSERTASEVGIKILKSGGNAIDAAVATAFALAVTYPGAGNIGGGGFLVFYKNDGLITTIDFREKAPMATSAKMYLDDKGNIHMNSNHEGILSVGVPGTVAGLELAHKKYGNMSWNQLVEPAIKLAQNGFPISHHLSGTLKHFKKGFLKYPSSAKVFLKKDSTAYNAGEIWHQPDLANTLKRIRKYGAEDFYNGETARLISEFMKQNGGLITFKDLKKYIAIERKPIHGIYRGYDLFSMGPPSSGGITLIEMLNILEGYDLKNMGHNSSKYLHVLTETMRLAYLDRARYLGDLDFNPDMPVKMLLSKEYSTNLRKLIQMNKTLNSKIEDINQSSENLHTTHFSIIDVDGNAVSLTYTIESWFGSEIVVEGAGFLLNNEMGDFNPMPGKTDDQGHIGTRPNIIEPEKRMLSSMCPTIVLKDNKPFLIIGSPGGRTIINTILQIILNIIDFNMNIAEAIAARRIHHQWIPDVTIMEKGVTTIDSKIIYENLGHKTKIDYSMIYNEAMGILIDNKNNIYHGAADPRSSIGAAIGY